MPTYTAEFHTDAEWASLEIKAPTPETALAKARALDFETLIFERYEDVHPVNCINVRDADYNNLAEWQDDELRLRLASPALLEAAEKVIARWESGDLAAAVRELNAAVDQAKGDRVEEGPQAKSVIVEVSGGVAEITQWPAGVTVKVIDHDIAKEGGAA